MNNMYAIVFGVIMGLGFVMFIVVNSTNQNSDKNNQVTTTGNNNPSDVDNKYQGWRSVELSDARTGEKFRISDFARFAKTRFWWIFKRLCCTAYSREC